MRNYQSRNWGLNYIQGDGVTNMNAVIDNVAVPAHNHCHVSLNCHRVREIHWNRYGCGGKIVHSI